MRTRDHLANVRTTLAWVRTGMILMGVGYSTDKLAELDILHRSGGALSGYGRPLGGLAIGAGVAVAAAALPRFLRARARIESERFEPRPGLDLALIAAIGAGGLCLLVLVAVTR